MSAAAKNKARLRNRVRRAQQSDDLPLWKGWIWNSNDPNMGQHALWRDSPHAERRTAPRRRAASPRRVAAEAAFTLTKIDTLSDQLLSSQLRFTRKIIRAVWIAPRYRNATSPSSSFAPRDIVGIFRDGINERDSISLELMHLTAIDFYAMLSDVLFKTALILIFLVFEIFILSIILIF